MVSSQNFPASEERETTASRGGGVASSSSSFSQTQKAKARSTVGTGFTWRRWRGIEEERKGKEERESGVVCLRAEREREKSRLDRQYELGLVGRRRLWRCFYFYFFVFVVGKKKDQNRKKKIKNGIEKLAHIFRLISVSEIRYCKKLYCSVVKLGFDPLLLSLPSPFLVSSATSSPLPTTAPLFSQFSFSLPQKFLIIF